MCIRDRTYTVSAQNGPVTGSSSDIQLPNGRTASDIDGTSWHTCALLDNGSISCWGVNTHGQWGDGTCSSSSSSCSGTDGNVPSYALMPSPAIALATGIESTCAINQSYSLFCWGSQSGEFDGSSNDILVPYLMDFNNSTLGESVAYSEQDIDGDGIRNVLDLIISDDSDGDGFNSSIDDFPDNPARWVSCPDGQWGRLSCQNSSSGHFSLQGSLFHESCTIGNYQPDEGQTLCYEASSGYFVDEEASPDQQHCDPGFYQNDPHNHHAPPRQQEIIRTTNMGMRMMYLLLPFSLGAPPMTGKLETIRGLMTPVTYSRYSFREILPSQLISLTQFRMGTLVLACTTTTPQ